PVPVILPLVHVMLVRTTKLPVPSSVPEVSWKMLGASAPLSTSTVPVLLKVASTALVPVPPDFCTAPLLFHADVPDGSVQLTSAWRSRVAPASLSQTPPAALMFPRSQSAVPRLSTVRPLMASGLGL